MIKMDIDTKIHINMGRRMSSHTYMTLAKWARWLTLELTKFEEIGCIPGSGHQTQAPKKQTQTQVSHVYLCIIPLEGQQD